MRSLVTVAALLAATASALAAPPHPEWTLYTPFSGSTTYLLDLDGNTVQTWPSGFIPGISVYLTDNGSIIRPARDTSVSPFGGAGLGGRIQQIGWNGTVEWNYVAAGPDYVQHHDIEVLPNGNILAIVWERFTASEAIAMGRDPGGGGSEVWAEAILEIEPVGATGGNIVWEWHVWDHLVQDFDAGLPNFGDPADNPGRIDINVGSSGSDWLHWNGIDYNAELDQIVVSSRNLSEIWIISHAPGDAGDLLYRWGNPQNYGRGNAADQRLFGQHDPEWIPDGIPGAGHLTVYNNGDTRGYSSIDELDTGVKPDGTYDLPASDPYGPADVAWTCDSIDGNQFLSLIMSGVQRLPNGNHLICPATSGVFIEVDENCNTVWSYDSGNWAFRSTRIDARDPRLEGRLWTAGDANGDMIVDVQDLLVVITEWGSAGPAGDIAPLPGGDGVVDIQDLVLVILQWDS